MARAANKAGGNALGKILGSQLGQGIGSGAAAGAAGAAAGTLAQGGTLQDALTNAWEGAKGGAVAGGAMAGTMGLAGNALNRIRGGRATNIADNAPIPQFRARQRRKLSEKQGRSSNGAENRGRSSKHSPWYRITDLDGRRVTSYSEPAAK